MASAKGQFADLHVHTWFSDSSLSPVQAVEEAVGHGVGVRAIADHEGLAGSRAAEGPARAAGLDFISAAELECTDQGVQLHILCYGADRDNGPLRALAMSSRRILDQMSETLIARMARDYPALSLEDYARFSFDRGRGGWKGLGYLMAKGVTSSLKEGMPLYGAYKVGYEQAGFPGLEALLAVIHGAGGRAVLAHPGHSLRELGFAAMAERVRALADRGLDGIECYYPLHDEAATKMFRALCEEKGLLITAGSDCHGTFGQTRVGEMNVQRSLLRLEGLLD